MTYYLNVLKVILVPSNILFLVKKSSIRILITSSSSMEKMYSLVKNFVRKTDKDCSQEMKTEKGLANVN